MFRKRSQSPLINDYFVDSGAFYDFLFDNDYSPTFCNRARNARGSVGTRHLKDFVLRLHTGETLAPDYPEWSPEERERLGQRYIRDLAEDILQRNADKMFREGDILLEALAVLLKHLELDGYMFDGSTLLEPEEDVLDVQEESGVLKSLYTSLNLESRDTTFHHLSLSESHYIDEKWDDSISNSRKFLENVLSEVASSYHHRLHGTYPDASMLSKPFKVRIYLEQEGLLESKETEAVEKVYGLLSETGGHPYMASSDQARLLRHLSLTFSQFVMLRLRGIESANST